MTTKQTWNLAEKAIRTALEWTAGLDLRQGGGEGSSRRTARFVMADGACGAGGNKVEYKEN